MAIRKTVAGTFEVDFRDQYKKRIQRTFDTHRDAVAFQKEALAQVAKREYVRPSKKTVSEEADEGMRAKPPASIVAPRWWIGKTTLKTTSSPCSVH